MPARSPTLPAGPRATDAATLLESALAAHQAGQLDTAEELYHRILMDEPDQPTVLANLGMLHYQRRDLRAAAEWYERALAVRRTPEVLSNLSMLRRTHGDFASAIQLLTEALALRPGFSDALHNLGMTYIDANQPAQAVAPLLQRVRDTPTDPDVHANADAGWIVGWSRSASVGYSQWH